MLHHPVTHAKNTSQHLGQIILDTRQKHCTSEQKRQDNTHIQQEKDEQNAAQALAIQWVANTIISEAEAEKSWLTKCSHPRPHSAPSQAWASTTNGKSSDWPKVSRWDLLEPFSRFQQTRCQDFSQWRGWHGEKQPRGRWRCPWWRGCYQNEEVGCPENDDMWPCWGNAAFFPSVPWE